MLVASELPVTMVNVELSPSTRRRYENIRVLLRTLNDIYPGPESVNHAESGLAPSRFVPCPACRFNRKVNNGCLACNGMGERPRRRGEAEWDGYSKSPVANAEAKRPEPMSPQRIESEINRAQLDLRLRSGEIDGNESYGWERARASRDKGTSYAELERVLGVMQIEEPMARSAINWIYFAGVGAVLPESDETALIEWISDRMRGKVRVPRAYFESQQAETHTEIKRLLKTGLSDLEVARELGVSRQSVRECVTSETAGILPVTLRGQDEPEPPHGEKLCSECGVPFATHPCNWCYPTP